MNCGFNILSGFKLLERKNIHIHLNFEFDHGSLATLELRGESFLALAFNPTFHMTSRVIYSQ